MNEARPLPALPLIDHPVTPDTSPREPLRYRVTMSTRSLSGLKSQTVTSNSAGPAKRVGAERVEQRILSMRGQKVMLSTDLAELYEVAPQGIGAGRQAQPGSLPRGLYVSADPCGVRALEVTICDFKLGRGATRHFLRIHGAGRRHALQRPAQPQRRTGEHCHHARLRQATGDPGDASGTGSATQGDGKQI